MRSLSTIAIWIALVGGLALYMHSRDEPTSSVGSFQVPLSEARLSLEVTPSVALAPDPFAVRTDVDHQAAALLVKLNGRPVLKRTNRVEAGRPVVVEKIRGLIQGMNEFYLEAYPPLKGTARSHALRIRIFSGLEAIAEHTLWSDQGSRIAGTFSFEMKTGKPTEEPDHAH